MRTTLIALLLTIATFIGAQDYDYQIELNADSTFTLLIIEEFEDNTSTIKKYNSLDTSQVRDILYSEINNAYENIAVLEREIDAKMRYRSEMLIVLRSVGIDNYMEDTRQRVSYSFMANWLYRNSLGETDDLYTRYLPNNDITVMMSASDSTTNVATIIPYSGNNIIYNVLPAGTNRVTMYSNGGRLYVGTDAEGVRHVLIRKR